MTDLRQERVARTRSPLRDTLVASRRRQTNQIGRELPFELLTIELSERPPRSRLQPVDRFVTARAIIFPGGRFVAQRSPVHEHQLRELTIILHAEVDGSISHMNLKQAVARECTQDTFRSFFDTTRRESATTRNVRSSVGPGVNPG